VMKDLDKATMKSLLHSAKKAKMTVFTWKVKRYHNDSIDSIRYYKSFYNRVWWQWNHKLEILKHGLRYHYKYLRSQRSKTSRVLHSSHLSTAIEQLNISLRLDHWCAIYNASRDAHATGLVTKKLWQPVPRNGNFEKSIS
jgi:hypothetical protein